MRRLLPLLLMLACDPAGVGVSAVKDAQALDARRPDARPVDAGATDAQTVDAQIADAAPPAIPRCVPDPPEETAFVPGENAGGPRLTVGGRRITPAGPNVVVPGFPTAVVVHADRGVAYVSSTSTDDRRLLVMDLQTHEVLQDVDRGEAFFGLALSPDDTVLYASGGVAGSVDVFAIQDDGTVMHDATIEVGGYPAGIAVSPDGAKLWVGLFDNGEVVEVDAVTRQVLRRLPTPAGVWDVLHLPDRNEIYASTLTGTALSVLDLTQDAPAVEIPVPTSPAGLARNVDGRVLVAVSGANMLAAIDPVTRTVDDWVWVAEDDFVNDAGEPLGNSNLNAVAVDPETERVYVSRGADNAVSVLDARTLQRRGAIPTAWYPTDIAWSLDRLVVIEGKGGGAGPSTDGQGAKKLMKGSVTFVDLARLDLPEATAQVQANFARTQTAFPFECESAFPIPTQPNARSPIEHVVLIVKENKTFDCILGDLDDDRVRADPTLVRYGEDITPNTHALARTFALSDNFYTEVQNSDGGHIMLTSGHLTEFAERVWIEKARTGEFQGFQIGDPATPDQGNLFTHLMDHDIDIQIYGEIVGMFIPAANGLSPIVHSDQGYPGGAFYNTGVPDERKARHVVSKIESGRLAAFTYLLLPTDHTEGTKPGVPTPESMVSDNDYAVGLVVEALSTSPFWSKTAVFILQDDTQSCDDHIDAHRSILMVAGPYARRGHVSHVHVSMVSVIATMLRILGVPPMGRPDAASAPLWDMFTDAPDLGGYVAIPRRVPDGMNPEDAPGAKKSARMAFNSPDRNPELGVILDAYRLWKMGRITKDEAKQRIERPALSAEKWADLFEEAEEETTAFDRSWRRYEAWLNRR